MHAIPSPTLEARVADGPEFEWHCRRSKSMSRRRFGVQSRMAHSNVYKRRELENIGQFRGYARLTSCSDISSARLSLHCLTRARNALRLRLFIASRLGIESIRQMKFTESTGLVQYHQFQRGSVTSSGLEE